jgi:hypothetical protein
VKRGLDQEHKIMDEKGDNFQKVSITNDDIAQIAIAVKDILKLDIEHHLATLYNNIDSC